MNSAAAPPHFGEPAPARPKPASLLAAPRQLAVYPLGLTAESISQESCRGMM